MSVLKGMTYTITTCSIAASPVLLDVILVIMAVTTSFITTCSIAASPVLLDVILVIMAVTTSFKHIYDGLVSLTGA
jgi:hypothetical protein